MKYDKIKSYFGNNRTILDNFDNKLQKAIALTKHFLAMATKMLSVESRLPKLAKTKNSSS